MCKTARKADKKWLQKIRPVAGHDTHFHVRLKCPAGARLCETQTPTVSELSNGGNGCDDTLMWWVTDYPEPAQAVRQETQGPGQAQAGTARLHHGGPAETMRRRSGLALIAAGLVCCGLWRQCDARAAGSDRQLTAGGWRIRDFGGFSGTALVAGWAGRSRRSRIGGPIRRGRSGATGRGGSRTCLCRTSAPVAGGGCGPAGRRAGRQRGAGGGAGRDGLHQL